ncbi:hypothetical protein [Aliiroseovarius lamellibrachiae]|uniref:hypothetical protein n=1 Tax=Aliiroseovarius lamellibrachiae TaxID=1924933 RepID=UPI001BDFFA48|nr:hypothetical protein [Aliiroseovarius lamellibrachiae]
MPDAFPTPELVTRVLRGIPLPVSTEAAMQDAVEQALTDHAFPFERELRMGSSNRIDFMVQGGIGIEVKTRCARRQIHRQLARYADHPDVNALILVTGTFTGLPVTLNGKPLFLVSSGRASL